MPYGVCLCGFWLLNACIANDETFELKLTNGEVRKMFEGLVHDWISNTSSYGQFLKALMQNDLKYMNHFMNDVAFHCFSSFDTGSQPTRTEPERFYHGFVL